MIVFFNVFDLFFLQKKGVTRSVALLNSQPEDIFFCLCRIFYDERQADDARDLVTSLTFP